MVQELIETYTRLLNTPGSYLSGQAEQQRQSLQQTAQRWMEQAQQQQQAFQQQQQSFQQMVQDVTNTYVQLFNVPVSYAQECLQAVRFPLEGYDDLTVEEVHRLINDLSLEELKMVRDYEERTKKRNTVLEELDRKIRSGS
jgi:uncharacterized membrane protein YheB (UPF0754 family)